MRMVADLAVVAVHGVGPTRPDYADRFRQAVLKRVARHGQDAERVHIESVRWAHILDGRHRDLLHRMEGAGTLRHRAMRKFVLAAVGESGAYREVGTRGHRLYEEVHEAVRDGLARARDACGGDVPLVLVAHSLGTVIASDHVWDEQNDRGRGRAPFDRCETLTGLVTMGSPLPLYTLAHDRIRAIRFPGPSAPVRLRRRARWLNLYDPDDVLGWPLRPTAPPYEKVIAEDIRINVGGPLTFWNPLSHLGYWDDGTVHKHVAGFVADLLEANAPVVRVAPRTSRSSTMVAR